MELLRDH